MGDTIEQGGEGMSIILFLPCFKILIRATFEQALDSDSGSQLSDDIWIFGREGWSGRG